jgi:antitoxin ParD1/3/4
MASKNTSIALGDHFADYARQQVASGAYGSTSEVVREALRLHEERASYRARLLKALDEGLASPIAEDFDIDDWFAEEFGTK